MLYENQYIITYLATVGGINASQTTGIKLQSVAGIDTTKPSILLLDYADPLDETKAEWVSYLSIDVNQELVGAVRGAEKGSGVIHSQNAVIAFPHSESHNNQFADIFNSSSTSSNAEDLLLKETASPPTTPDAGYKKIYADTDGFQYILNSAGTAIKLVNENMISDVVFRQAIINGNFDVDQQVGPYTASRNNDDVYVLDNWNLISDGNDAVDVSQEAITDLPGSNYAIKLDTETAKRYGIAQFIEAKDAQKYKGKTVSISFAVKSANIAAIRATVLSWASTADAITSDVVATWGATPTWATNWADNATPADLAVTSSWTTVKVEGIVLDEATINNLALVIWTPNEETIGDIIYISQVQMNEGSTAKTFQPKTFAEELRACQKYWYKTYEYAVAPGTASTESTSIYSSVVSGYSRSICNVSFPTTMRITPTITPYHPSKSNVSGKIGSFADGTTEYTINSYGVNQSVLSHLGHTADTSNPTRFHFVADARL